MKKIISFRVFIRNTIIVSMVLTIALFVLYGKYIQSSSIEKSIKNDAGVMADLVFQNLFTAMKSGANKEEIYSIIHDLEDSIIHVNIELLQENSKKYPSLIASVYSSKTPEIEQFGEFVAFVKPILYTSECLSCHNTKKQNDVASVILIEFPIFNLQISLSEIVLLASTLLFITMIVFFSSWYYYLKKYFVVPVKQLAQQINQITSHDDLENKVHINSTLRELKQIEKLFNEQNSKLKVSYEQLKELSDTDTLTGIYNRKKFDEYSLALITHAKRYEHNFCLVLIDLNYFKIINDTHGHDVGDDILILFTKLVNASIRESDYLFRTGGDEFILLLPETYKKDAKKLIEKIEESFKNNPYEKDELKLNVQASFGLVEFPTDSQNIKELMKEADKQMYEDKKQKKATRE